MEADESDGRTRRACLRSLGAAGASALAGCAGVTGGDGTPTASPLEPTCSESETATWGPYADWFPHFDGGEYDRSTARFTTVATPIVDAAPGFGEILLDFLEYPRRIAGQLSLPVRDAERLTYLRPPPESLATHFAFRDPADPAARQRWFDRFRLGLGQGQTVEELDDYRGFARYQVTTPGFRLVAFDGEYVVVVPDAGAGVEIDPGPRFERLVDTKRGDRPAGPCYRPAARALVAAMPAAHFARLWLRTDGGSFDGGDSRGPAGARASALGVRLRGPDLPAPVPAADADGPPAADPTATASPTADSPAERVAEFSFAAAFPEGSVDADATRSYVADRWVIDGDPAGGLGFVDPSFERSGQVVAVTGSRPLDTVVG